VIRWKEWDQERKSQFAAHVEDSTILNQSISLSDLPSIPNTVRSSPEPMERDNEHSQEVDITDFQYRQSTQSTAYSDDILQPQGQNDVSAIADPSNTALGTAPRSSTVELDNMEQGRPTNMLRRRTTAQSQEQVCLRSHCSRQV
jgi:hypothetical protein